MTGVLSRRRCLFLMGAGLSGLGAAAPGTLVRRWREAAAGTDGAVGVAALHLGSGDQASLRGDERFPLASVCKVPIAMHILAMVDEGALRLGDLIEIPAQDVSPGVSPIAERWPAERRFTLDDLLELMVAKSDNTAVETLLRIGGGPPAMAARFRQWHSDGIRIDRSERACGLNPRDTATPRGTVDFGVITLPGNAGQFAVAVYVKGSTRGEAARDHVIANIARITFDF